MPPRRSVGRNRFAHLRTFAEFWKYDAPTLACCLFQQDDEALEVDCEAYNCDGCPIADELAALEVDAANFEAWTLFQQLFSRFSVDTHVAHVLMERLMATRDPEDAFELMQRFTLLYDVLQPPPEKK